MSKTNIQLSTYQKENKSQLIKIQQQKEIINKYSVNFNASKDANKHLKYLGKFLVTYYDLKVESCGKYPTDKGYGITRSGNPVEINVSCAVDTSVIQLGSYLYVDGVGCRIAQDTGSAIRGNHLDIFINDFSYDKYHTHYSDVWLIK